MFSNKLIWLLITIVDIFLFFFAEFSTV